MNLRKIIREELEGFEWMDNVTPSNNFVPSVGDRFYYPNYGNGYSDYIERVSGYRPSFRLTDEIVIYGVGESDDDWLTGTQVFFKDTGTIKEIKKENDSGKHPHNGGMNGFRKPDALNLKSFRDGIKQGWIVPLYDDLRDSPIREEVTNTEDDWDWGNSDTLTYTIDEWLNNKDLFDILRTLSNLDEVVPVYLSGDFVDDDGDGVPIENQPFRLRVVHPEQPTSGQILNLVSMSDIDGSMIGSGGRVGMGEFEGDYDLIMRIDVSGF